MVTQNRLWVAITLVVFLLGVALGDQGLMQTTLNKGEKTQSQFTSLLTGAGENGASSEVALPQLIVDMPFENYNLLLAQRDEALESGIFLASEADLLNADIRLENQTIPVRLRLTQGLAVHLGEDDKWNFDIRTRNDQLLLGMSRFFLVDPADHNWLDEWAFMESLRREGILAPRYQFVHLIFNGDDRGIYALQEGFGPELMTEQSREAGVVVEFDADQLWRSISHIGSESAALANPITNLSADNFQVFEVDTFRDATIARDELLVAQKNQAIGLLRGLQNGELTAQEVFDVEKYGRFLALVDLWGATQALSLVNLRYYYQPQTGKLEPVGFNGTPVLDDDTQRVSLRAAYNDPAIQAAYVSAAEQFSQPIYLTQLQADLETTWQIHAQQVNAEIDYSAPWPLLAHRQELLRRSLNPAQPVLAYLGPPALSMEGIIQVDVANILNLPVEIVGFDFDGVAFLEANREWLQGEPVLLDTGLIILPSYATSYSTSADGVTAPLTYTRFHIPLTKIIEQNSEIDFNHEITVNLISRLVGQENTILVPARAGYPPPLIGLSLDTADQK